MFSLQTDASVGTEMGTMTEPECIGPLDPGTSVTLEGIVWHETDGGMVFIFVVSYIDTFRNDAIWYNYLTLFQVFL